MMTLGHGALISFSCKQKLNAKSSTETELIDVNDALPQLTRTRYFIEEQGYNIIRNTLSQDYKSAIIMEEEGKTKTQNKQNTSKFNIYYRL